MFSNIDITVENGIGRLFLNKPEKKNALSRDMVKEINQALTDFAQDSSVRVVVIRGKDGCFCAGGDVAAMKERVDCFAKGVIPTSDHKENLGNLNKIILTIRKMPKPVVSVIEGSCAGGGVSIALASDFAFTEENCRFTCAFVNVGLAPDMGSSLMLPARVGACLATDLFMTGKRFSGAQAADWKIVTRAFRAEELSDDSEKLIQKLAEGPTASYAEIKASVNRNIYPNLEEVMQNEINAADKLIHTKDHAEAVTAFIEKITPHFHGQ